MIRSPRARQGLFHQVTAGPGAKGFEDELVVLVNGEHEDGERGEHLPRPARPVNAGHAGKPDVQEEDVRASLGQPAEHLLAGSPGPPRNGTPACRQSGP